jgi:hypothetical protein
MASIKGSVVKYVSTPALGPCTQIARSLVIAPLLIVSTTAASRSEQNLASSAWASFGRGHGDDLVTWKREKGGEEEEAVFETCAPEKDKRIYD